MRTPHEAQFFHRLITDPRNHFGNRLLSVGKNLIVREVGMTFTDPPMTPLGRGIRTNKTHTGIIDNGYSLNIFKQSAVSRTCRRSAQNAFGSLPDHIVSPFQHYMYM